RRGRHLDRRGDVSCSAGARQRHAAFRIFRRSETVTASRRTRTFGTPNANRPGIGSAAGSDKEMRRTSAGVAMTSKLKDDVDGELQLARRARQARNAAGGRAVAGAAI